MSVRITDIIKSVKELGHGGSQIQEAMTHLQEFSQKVKLSYDDMSRSTATVKRTVDSVRDVTETIQKGSTHIASGMDVIEKSMEKVSHLGDRITDISEDLNSEIQHFKTEDR